MIIERFSIVSKRKNRLDLDVTPEQIARWQNGEKIQNVMPHLTPDEREFLISGIYPGEWDALFPPAKATVTDVLDL